MAPATSRRSASVYLSLISKKKLSPEDVQQVLIAAFTAKNYIDCIKNLNEHEIDPQGYIDGLDRVRSHPPILDYEKHFDNRPVSDNRHFTTRIKNLPPQSPGAAKNLWNLRTPPIFALHIDRIDPDNRRSYETPVRFRGIFRCVEGKG